MSSGNPFGLSEISHYGTMQRVGGKAAGFINKKFFHPSSFRNQEKLWKAQTADAAEKRKQADMEKRRDEERQVEELRKQMYLAGQAKATDLPSFGGGGSSTDGPGNSKEQRLAMQEQNRRKALLKEDSEPLPDNEVSIISVTGVGQAESGADASKELVPAETLAKLVKSRYVEDKHARGHGAVWGSWFEREAMRWGFKCCKGTVFSERCPLAPPEDEEQLRKAKRPRAEGSRGKRKRGRAGTTDVEGGDVGSAAGNGSAAASSVGAAGSSAAASNGTAAGGNDRSAAGDAAAGDDDAAAGSASAAAADNATASAGNASASADAKCAEEGKAVAEEVPEVQQEAGAAAEGTTAEGGLKVCPVEGTGTAPEAEGGSA